MPCTILHLDKAMMMAGPDSIIYCRELMAPDFFDGFETTVLSCYESATANIICQGPNECIVDRANSRVIEKLESTVTEPRAIAIDGESLRTLQQVGLLEGFEGELDENHHRSTLGGWRFRGLPWEQC